MAQYCKNTGLFLLSNGSTGFPATLEIRENFENEFTFLNILENSGNLKKNHQKSGNLIVPHKGKVFGVCASYAMCPSCALLQLPLDLLATSVT